MIASLSSSVFVLQPIKTPRHSKLLCRNPRSLTIICRAESKPDKPSKRNAMEGSRPTRRNPRKPSYGTSRKSALKKSFSQEQVVFTTPVREDPVVAIIGGGLAGLTCALNLEKRGVRSTVFDTGIHGLGGRMGTRVIESQPLIFDHAAQFFTVGDSRFAELVNWWLEKGLVRQWHGLIGELEIQFCLSMTVVQTSMVNVMRPCWISKLEPFNGMWHLSENGKPCGQFDAIVIAHNGKCANRLLASSGLPLIARQMKRLELSSIWTLLAAFEDPLPTPGNTVMTSFEGAFVKGVDAVSWMANNTKKLFPSQSTGPYCWTFFSTPTYGKRNKVPQENIPKMTEEKVKAGMLEGVESALGLSKGSLQRPCYTRVQLWGAALPMNTPGIPCIFDPQGRAGICGDWLLGSSLEAAALSGMALANHIADYFQSGGSHLDEFAIGELVEEDNAIANMVLSSRIAISIKGSTAFPLPA
ncbi:hypothetical protein NE237_016067 [Protea cynaroides]|uniref:FAD/NAD(P)-binding oxidoreductase family protein n=1 Tax=Protea cynaroides TaxID=273540 RepID=A0A9Q0KFH6_9MAGN|nr:hypothetical protein NE237_016067 [Protea cynaroides]